VKLPAYPKYKPSGVEWLGDVPEHWEVKRLKTSAACWVSNVDKVPAEDEMPVRLCNYTDVYYHEHITPEMELMETTATGEEIHRFGLLEGDVLITKDSEEWNDIAVPALVKKSAPDLVCGYHLAITRPRPAVLSGDYLLRAFQSCAINQQFQVAASGVTRYGLPKSSIGGACIPLPSVPEQRAIAAFLDRETGRVDRLVGKKRELIERLQEKRAALIARTVTRGLNDRTIPVIRLRFFLSRIDTGFTPDSQNFPATNGESGVLKSGCVNRGIFDPTENKILSDDVAPPAKLEVKCGDVLMSRASGSADLIGSVAMVKEQPCAHLYLSDKTFRLRVNSSKCCPRFLVFAMGSTFLRGQIEQIISGAEGLAKNIAQGDIRELLIPAPPLPEQRAMADYLDAETGKLDGLVAKVGEAVERLQEYRTALITAAVTGKIDVRNAER